MYLNTLRVAILMLTKRNFASIQSAHVVPMNDMVVPYILTGYETLIPIKAGSKFVNVALEDGTVTKVTKNEVVVEYKTKGKVSYKLSSWTTKEEAGSCYTHELVTFLSEGTKVSKDDTITYDKLFFEPCIFTPKRVIYKQGSLVNVMLSEDKQTYEDSIAISKTLNTKLGTMVTKVKSFKLNSGDNIYSLGQVGDKVEPSTVLFTAASDDIPVEGKLDARAISILKEFGALAPKAKVKGEISKIVVYYNFDREQASESLGKIIDWSDGILKKATGFTGRVNNNYSIQGVPLLEGECEIKIYIQSSENMGTGDKCILSNQLKCTVSEVFEYDLTTEDNTKIDAVFSNKSIYARIVNSPNLIGTTSTLLKKIEDNVIKMYFG